MSRMGGTCSMHRRRSASTESGNNSNASNGSNTRGARRYIAANGWKTNSGHGDHDDDDDDDMNIFHRRTLRHSVVMPFPDESIDKLYANSHSVKSVRSIGSSYSSETTVATSTTTDTTTSRRGNISFVGRGMDPGDSALTPTGRKTKRKETLYNPKTLSDLCIDTICRSLPYLDGMLPEGLPQEIMDGIMSSLVKNSSLNLTTLKTLQNCDFPEIRLSGCRGVTDAWLEHLPQSRHINATGDDVSFEMQSDDDDEDGEVCKAVASGGDDDRAEDGALDDAYFLHRHAGNQMPGHIGNHTAGDEGDEGDDGDMDMDVKMKSTVDGSRYHPMNTNENEGRHEHRGSDDEDNSSTEQSFLSATSNPNHPHVGGRHTPQCHDHDVASMQHTDHSDRDAFHDCLIDEGEEDISTCLKFLDLSNSQDITDRGIARLAGLDKLEVALFNECHSLFGTGLTALQFSTQLTTLSLVNCRRLTDDALSSISHLTSLERLILQGCRCLTDRGICAISNLVDLVELDLSECDLLTDNSVQYLEGMNTLESLSLGWCRSITDLGIETLVSQPYRATNLKNLRLSRCPITAEGVDHLKALSALQRLDLNGCSGIGSAAMGKTLKELTNLEMLDVSYCPGIMRTSWQGKIRSLKTLQLCYAEVKDSHISRLCTAPALEELNLDSCPVGDRALANLAQAGAFPNLCALNLADSDISDIGMTHIAKLKKLKKLSLFFCNITSEGIRCLSDLKNLEVLNLDGREIGDDCVIHIKNLPKLRSLDIFSGCISDMGCHQIAEIKTLETLELCGGDVGDLGCSILATLKNLKTLNLAQNGRITNRGAESLARLTNLRALNLSSTQVNSNGLHALSRLKNLQCISIYGCESIQGGSSAVERFQSALPELRCIRSSHFQDADGMMVAPNQVGGTSNDLPYDNVNHWSSDDEYDDDNEDEEEEEDDDDNESDDDGDGDNDFEDRDSDMIFDMDDESDSSGSEDYNPYGR